MGLCVFISNCKLKTWKLLSLILPLIYWCFKNYSSNVSYLSPDRRKRWSFHVLCYRTHQKTWLPVNVLWFVSIQYMCFTKKTVKLQNFECWALLFHENTLKCYYWKDMFYYLLPVCYSCFLLPKYESWCSFCASAQTSWSKSLTMVERFLFLYKNCTVFTSDLSTLSQSNLVSTQ